jgi:hypothetical protein
VREVRRFDDLTAAAGHEPRARARGSPTRLPHRLPAARRRRLPAAGQRGDGRLPWRSSCCGGRRAHRAPRSPDSNYGWRARLIEPLGQTPRASTGSPPSSLTPPPRRRLRAALVAPSAPTGVDVVCRDGARRPYRLAVPGSPALATPCAGWSPTRSVAAGPRQRHADHPDRAASTPPHVRFSSSRADKAARSPRSCRPARPHALPLAADRAIPATRCGWSIPPRRPRSGPAILAGDIGGTKAVSRFDARWRSSEAVPVRGSPSLEAIPRRFSAGRSRRPHRGCFGVAGPCGHGRQDHQPALTIDAVPRLSGVPVALLNDPRPPRSARSSSRHRVRRPPARPRAPPVTRPR